jgi:hypothetical protein
MTLDREAVEEPIGLATRLDHDLAMVRQLEADDCRQMRRLEQDGAWR